MAVSAPASPRQRLSPTERRERLLELGLELFGESSFDQLSTDEIAAKAGISRGLLFHYFGSKRGYYVAVIRAAADRLLDRSQAAHGSVVGGDSHRSQLDVFLAFVEENAGLYTLLMQSGVGVDHQVQEIVDETRGVIAMRVAPQLAESAEPDGLEPGSVEPGSVEPGSADRLGLVAWIGAVEAAASDWADQRRRGVATLDRRELAELLIRMLPPTLETMPDLDKEKP